MKITIGISHPNYGSSGLGGALLVGYSYYSRVLVLVLYCTTSSYYQNELANQYATTLTTVLDESIIICILRAP